MRVLEDMMNGLTDLDAGWWPGLSLRAPKDAPIDTARLLKMALLFGPVHGGLFGLLWVVMDHRTSHTWVLWPVAAAAVAYTPLFFALYRVTFVIAWNRRAARLRSAPAQAAPGVGP